MQKLKVSIIKEIKTFRSDLAGVLLTLIMPIFLVLLITTLQESTFEKIQNINYKILIVKDQEFDISTFSEFLSTDNPFIIQDTVISDVNGIDYGVLSDEIEWDFSLQINKSDWEEIQDYFLKEGDLMFSKLMGTTASDSSSIVLNSMKITYSPNIPPTYHQKLKYAIEGAINNFELKQIVAVFYNALKEQGLAGSDLDVKPKLKLEENELSNNNTPNSVQHNVPAWSVFAIFFIIVPLSTSIINEKTIGVYRRLKMIPSALMYWYWGKVIAYSFLAVLQFFIIWGIGIYLFPHMSLPPLNMLSNPLYLFLGILAISFMAISFGLLIAALFHSVQQAGAFGSICIIIFAAIGGIWIPNFLMDDSFQTLSKVSPLNWSISYLYDVILKDISFIDMLKFVLPIFTFSGIINIIALKKFKTTSYE